MNSKRSRLDELKIKASLLLKNLQADDAKAIQAAKRFLALPFLKHSNETAILNDRSFFRLKHALQVIAIENGYGNWNALRTQIIREDCLFHNASPAHLNVWFNSYEEAAQYHKTNGGYLLQYRNHYAVCTKEYIASLGLDDMEEYWKAIGYDWVRPLSATAWNKLFEAAKKRYLQKVVPPKPIDKSKRLAWLAQHS